jgi:hypothetical protein
VRWRRAAAVLALVLGACRTGDSQSVHRLRYPGGQVKWQIEMRGGLPDGNSITYDETGQLRSRGIYVAGRKHGLFQFFRTDGSLEIQRYYWRGVEIWSSVDPKASPPRQLLDSFAEEERARGGPVDDVDPAEFGDLPARVDDGPPQPYFTSLDRTTSVTRVGVHAGRGGSSIEQVWAERASVFGNYRIGPASAYAQFDASRLRDAYASVAGRTTLELGGGYHLRLGRGMLSGRVGVLAPIDHDDLLGSMVTAASAFQRPTDSVSAMASTVAIRTGASWTRSFRRQVVQLDSGVDWAAGGTEDLRPLGRANAAIGIGDRSLIGTLELSNAVRLDDPGKSMHALGVGGAVWMRGGWFNALLSRTSGGHTTLTVGVGYGH